MKEYDLLVIGFGKAGKTFASKYANLGKKVALVEQSDEMYGGTCINIACIPTKTLIACVDKKADFETAKKRRDMVVSKLRAKNFEMINNNPNISLFTSKARFIEDKIIEIEIDGKIELLTAKLIVINTGARTNIPNIKGLLSTKNVVDSTELQKIEKLPKTLGILGAGNIGLEFADLFARLGSKVTVLDTSASILGSEEEVVSKLAKTYLEEDGVEFKLDCKTEEVYNKDDKVFVKTNQGEFSFDILMYATGRIPNIEGLGLENTNIELTDRKAIKVDEHCQTTVNGIFAVGDVNGGLQFTYTSLDDFRIIYNYILQDGNYTLKDRKNVAYTRFINPPLSRVGLTQKQALEQGYEILVKEHYVNNMPRHAINQDPRGIFKAIVDKNTKLILGATLFSKNSEELINLIKMAMDNDIKYTYLRDQVFTHPNMAENLNDLFNMN